MPWFWSTPADNNPTNRFTWFRTRFSLDQVPPDATIRFAASSNGQLYINGHPVRRKMTRFGKRDIRAEVVYAAPHLRSGPNVIAILHHHWGPILTFQRDAETLAGIYVAAPWMEGASWKYHPAQEFLEHSLQIIGVKNGDRRIRFPVLATPANREQGIHDPAYDAASWTDAAPLPAGPWKTPAAVSELTIPDVDIPPQRMLPVLPAAVLAAGAITSAAPDHPSPDAIASQIAGASLSLDPALTRAAVVLTEGGFLTLTATPNSAQYITLDFHRPVHGYPVLTYDSTAQATIDFGYAELPCRQYDGYEQVKESGALDPEAIVGKGYADRISIDPTTAPEAFELPDERTARWLTLHIRYQTPGTLRLKLHFVSCQYPVTPIGSFVSPDPRINQAVALCDTHARITMVDGYVDTPGREDGLWIEDARLRARIGASWYGDDALRLFGIRQFAAFIQDNGTAHPFAPSNFPATCARDWASQWVGMIYDQYLWSADPELPRRYWPKIRILLSLFLDKIGDDGIWRESFIYGDIRLGYNPTTPNQSSGLITPWVIALLAEAITLAEALDENADRDLYQAAKDKVVQAFRRVHIVPATDDVPLHAAAVYAPDEPNKDRGLLQAAQCFPTTLNLFTPQEAAAALAYCFTESNLKPSRPNIPPVIRWNNPTYFQRALDALTHAGLHDLAWSHFQSRFSQFLPAHPNNPNPLLLQGPQGGPLPEYGITRQDLALSPGQINSAQPWDDTGSHGWYATPLVWLHEKVLGVTLHTPGAAHLLIRPQPGNHPQVSGHVHTPKGTVYINLDNTQGTLTIHLPRGTLATVTPPWPTLNPIPSLQGPTRVTLTRQTN